MFAILVAEAAVDGEVEGDATLEGAPPPGEQGGPHGRFGGEEADDDEQHVYATSWACVGFPRRGEGDASKCSVSISLSFENQGINPVGGSSKVPRTYTNKLRTRNQRNKGVVNPFTTTCEVRSNKDSMIR